MQTMIEQHLRQSPVKSKEKQQLDGLNETLQRLAMQKIAGRRKSRAMNTSGPQALATTPMTRKSVMNDTVKDSPIRSLEKKNKKIVKKATMEMNMLKQKLET